MEVAMSLQPADPNLLFADLIPQAEVNCSLEQLQDRLGLIERHDDLDDFTGGAFVVDGTLEFTLKHYKGSPSDTFTVYLPKRTENIRDGVARILSSLDLPLSSLTWTREQDPEL